MANEVRVLLADASEEYRILLTDTMEETGEFQVVGSTGDGAQLVQMAQQLQPQVVIMDLVLPGLDGFGALTALRKFLYLRPALCAMRAMPRCLLPGRRRLRAQRWKSFPARRKRSSRSLARVKAAAVA